MPKFCITDIEFAGKRVLIRVDFNVPIDKEGRILDDTRIKNSIPTIEYCLKRGGKVILISHLGRPGGEVVERLRLTPIARRLEELIGRKVRKLDDCIGDDVRDCVFRMKEGEIILLENIRFHKEEMQNDQSFSKELASLGEIYVNDAFGMLHRNHSSVSGITKYVPISVGGVLLKREIECLDTLLTHPKRPFVIILGGMKVSTKIGIIKNLLQKIDMLLIGGCMGYTFLKAFGKSIGKSPVEEEKLSLAREILIKSVISGIPTVLPSDHLISPSIDEEGEVNVVKVGEIPDGWEGVDIGPLTIEKFLFLLKGAKTIFWNGPMGVFEVERFSQGTNRIAKALAESEATTVVGGGESVAAVKKCGVADRITHVSTGGGACLEFLEGKFLPGLAALKDK